MCFQEIILTYYKISQNHHLKILEYNLIDVNWKPGLKSDDNNQKAVIPSGRGVKRGEKPNNKRQHQRR